MNRNCDIFERLPDGAVIWRECFTGLEGAKTILDGLAGSSENEFHATPAMEIVARMNSGGVAGK